jgi:hypothetical protein
MKSLIRKKIKIFRNKISKRNIYETYINFFIPILYFDNLIGKNYTEIKKCFERFNFYFDLLKNDQIANNQLF